MLPLALCMDESAKTEAHAGHGQREAKSGVSVEHAQSAGPKAVLSGALDFSAAALLAVQEGGRKKPLHTLASESIEQITGRPFFLATPYWKDPQFQETHTALDVYLSMWLHSRAPAAWHKLPIVLVAYLPLRKELGLNEAEKRFSFEQIVPPNADAEGPAVNKRSRFGELMESARAYRRDKRELDMPELEQQAEIVYARLEVFAKILNDEAVNCVPHPTDPNGTWISMSLLTAMYQSPEEAYQYIVDRHTRGDEKAAKTLYLDYLKGYKPEQIKALLEAFTSFRDAYFARDHATFAAASRDFHLTLVGLSKEVYPTQRALEREVDYNQTRPFGKAWVLYLLTLVLGALTFRVKARWVYAAVLAIFLLGMAIHVYGFVLRCLIAGRPPVSNMYESVIWVGFGTVAFGLIFELIYKPKYFMLCGAGGGFLCLVLMDLLPAVMGNPRMAGFEAGINPLVAVLRDNFWLTIHVLTITLSYAAFALAWVLGHVTLGKHLFSPANKADHRQMHQYVYRVLQIGVLLLATGTILGGVWAHYSWGRFWGWDPKETWAFIGLVCYLMVLHGRFTGWWGNFGMSVGSVVGFWPIVMAWYGVNFVLPKLGNGGLHSYGTGSGGENYVIAVALLDMLFAGAALLRYTAYRRAAAVVERQALSLTDPVDDARSVESAKFDPLVKNHL